MEPSSLVALYNTIQQYFASEVHITGLALTYLALKPYAILLAVAVYHSRKVESN